MTFEDVLLASVAWVMMGAFLAAIGHAIGSVIGESKHRMAILWRRTRALHPIAVGMLLGLAPSLPLPDAMGEGGLPRLIWYGTAGGLAVPIYEMLRRTLERRAR